MLTFDEFEKEKENSAEFYKRISECIKISDYLNAEFECQVASQNPDLNDDPVLPIVADYLKVIKDGDFNTAERYVALLNRNNKEKILSDVLLEAIKKKRGGAIQSK